MNDMLRPGPWGDGYEILRLAGRGGHAEVYEARDRFGQPRAIKVLATAEPGLADRLQARFAQEGYAISLIDHPNVVRYYGSGVQEDRLYLSLEYVHGRSLQQRMDRLNGVLPLEDVLRWVRDVCRGMVEAHRRKVVHRDLKPSNILVTDSGAVKVIDFGVAKLRGCGLATTTEQSFGTTLYMPPELMQSATANEQTDVYSVGVTLYQALTGVHPMGRRPKNLADIVMWLKDGKPRPLREVAPEVPRSIEDLVHRTLARNPDHRPQTMIQLTAELDEELEHARAPLRKHALNVVASLAPTIPLPAHSPAHPASDRPDSDPPRCAVPPPNPAAFAETPRASSRQAGAHGTAVMPATDARPHAAPSPSANSGRMPTEPMPVAVAPHQHAPLAATLPLLNAVPSQGDRRSTTAPVESSTKRSPRALAVAVAIGLVTLGVAVSWLLVGGTPSDAGRTSPASTLPSASVTSTPRPLPAATASPSVTSTAPSASTKRLHVPTPGRRP